MSAVAPADDAPLHRAGLPPLRERLIALFADDGQGRAALVQRLMRAWATDLTADERAADHSPAHDVHLVTVARPRRRRVRARQTRLTARTNGTEGGADGA